MDIGIDSGPIISKQITKCFKNDTYQKIRKRVHFDGYKFLSKFIKKLSQNYESLSKNIIYGEENKGGNYYKPMESNLINEVIRKIENQNYKFQKNI